jgi:hypothetical protein
MTTITIDQTELEAFLHQFVDDLGAPAGTPFNLVLEVRP